MKPTIVTYAHSEAGGPTFKTCRDCAHRPERKCIKVAELTGLPLDKIGEARSSYVACKYFEARAV